MIELHREAERRKVLARSFDYVIVGAGSAGCVVARRLLDGTDVTVLLLEAGGSGEGVASLSNPPQWLENIGSRYDWTYSYEPSPHVDHRSIPLPLGKVLGGSVSINLSGSLSGRHAAAAGRAGKDNAMKNSYWLFNTRLSVLAGHAETGGRYDLVEGWFSPGTQTPPHRHGAYSEQLYVLDGEFTVWAGGRRAVLRPGDDLIIPAGTAHVVAATGGGPVRGLVVASPSGFARLITEVGTPDGGDGAPPSAPLDLERFLRVSAELGDEILGPPGALPD